MHEERDGKDGPERSADRGGLERLSQQELQRALGRLNADITANPDDATALCARGLVHRELGDDRRAKEDFGRVIALSPGNTEARHNRGLASARLQWLGGDDEANRDFQRFFELAPDEAEPFL